MAKALLITFMDDQEDIIYNELKKSFKNLSIPIEEFLEKDNEIFIDNLRLIPTKLMVIQDEVEKELRPKEFFLLYYLAQHPGRVFSSEELYQYLWGERSFSSTNTIPALVSKIRKKIETDPKKPNYILTVRDLGYKFNSHVISN